MPTNLKRWMKWKISQGEEKKKNDGLLRAWNSLHCVENIKGKPILQEHQIVDISLLEASEDKN